MELLGTPPKFDINDKKWRIYSRTSADAPHFVGDHGQITNSLITEGCEIDGVVENSVLSNGVKVERGAYVKDSVIMSDVVIKAGAAVNYSILDEGAVICEGAVVGQNKDIASGITVVGGGIEIPAAVKIPSGAMVNEEYVKENLK